MGTTVMNSSPGTKSITEKESYRKRINLMVTERTTFIDYWKDLSRYHLGHRGRFLVSDRNKGFKRDREQINNTSRLAVRTLASGMMAGITSPARPWFKLGLSNKKLLKDPEVKAWLTRVEHVMREIFNQSNLYNSLHITYQELGTFATASMGIFEDYQNVIHCKPYTVGSYMLALNGKDKVDTWAREYQLTVAQLVNKFGLDNCSQSIQRQWKTGNLTNWVDLYHIVEPNDNRDSLNPLARFKNFRSCYFEKSAKNRDNRFLLKSGFNEFPILAPRWEVTGEDIYGTSCPGMTALGDTKALQMAERMKYEAIEKMVDPHMLASTNMRHGVNNELPSGGISFVDNPKDGLVPAYTVQPRIEYHTADIKEIEERINKSFFADLFLMLASLDRRQITAREVAERHEEKLLMLGPVLERLHNELLDPLIDRTFNIGLRARIFDPVPDMLRGKELQVEYISILAQAQKIVEIGKLENTAAYISNLSQIWPEVRHKFNPDVSVDEYVEASGVTPRIVKTPDQYQDALDKAAGAATQQQEGQAGLEMTQAAKNLSETDTEGKNALTDMMKQAGA
jgi:hypothetical protein